MRWAALDKLKTNRILAQNILDERGRILLAKGVELSDSMVRRLGRVGIFSACVEDPLTKDIELQEVISPQLRGSLVSATYESLLELAQHESNRYVRSPNVRKKLQPLVDEVIGSLREVKGAGQHLGNVYLTDGELYHHSVNVSLFALSLGIHRGLSENELVEMGIGSLLHDVGKLRVAGAVLKKPGRLTDDEFEQIKRHTTLGYDILRRLPEIPGKAALVSLEHHERADGTGYPRGLTLHEIHHYSRIVSVADVYEALTANRVYRRGYLPHEAYELLLGSGGIQFDESVVESFVETIAVYPVGLTLTLSSGERAVVVQSKPRQSHRPIVRVIARGDGTRLETPYELDLSEHLTTRIIACES